MSWIEQANLRIERKAREQQDALDALKRELPITEEFVGTFLNKRTEPMQKIVAELRDEGFQVIQTDPKFFFDPHLSEGPDEKVRQYSFTLKTGNTTEYYIDHYHTIFGMQWEIKYPDQNTIGYVRAYSKKGQQTHIGCVEYIFYSPSWTKIKTYTDNTDPDPDLRAGIALYIDTHLERIKNLS